MKRTLKSIISSSLALALCVCALLSFASCEKQAELDMWENANYSSQTTLGEGEKTFTLEVKAQEKTVAFTVKTDKATVGEALLDCGLITGEQGPYGMYIKEVNGIVADYDVDGTYWAFYINGEYAMTGVDTTEIAEGATYQLERTK